MSKRISKRAIKKLIESYENHLKELEAETQQLQKENDESKYLLYDLTENYLNEEKIRGKIEASKYILNHC